MLPMNSTCFFQNMRVPIRLPKRGRLFHENAPEVDGQEKVISSTAKRSTVPLDFLVGSALTTGPTLPEVRHPT